MRLSLIDFPTPIVASKYDDLSKKLTRELISSEGVLSVYQMGSVKHPGISDLDIICVFKNGSQCRENFRLDLSSDEKNILTHGLFGIEEQDLFESISYNLISNLKYLGGKNLNLDKLEIHTSSDIKKQIALEYLVKMLITIDAQVTLKIVKLRAFLLLAKAIEFDLELLDVNKGKLYDLVQQVIKLRGHWYSKKPSINEITDLILSFNNELKIFLEKELLASKLYLPAKTISLPGNFTIQRNHDLSIAHSGLVLPNQFGFIGRKYINLQYRLNKFIYNLPFSIPKSNSVHDERFLFSRKIVQTNCLNFPHFIPLTTSLSIY